MMERIKLDCNDQSLLHENNLPMVEDIDISSEAMEPVIAVNVVITEESSGDRNQERRQSLINKSKELILVEQ